MAKQKVIQAELEEKLVQSEGNLEAARTKSNVSISPQINLKKFAQHGFGQCEKSISLVRKIHSSTVYGFQKVTFYDHGLPKKLHFHPKLFASSKS